MARSRTLTVQIVGDAKGFGRALDTVDRRTKGTQAHLDTFGKRASASFASLAKGAAGLAAAYVSIAAAKDAITTTTDLAKATIGLNKNLGLSIERASEWAAVAKVRGVETKQLNQAFGTLARQSQAAAQGTQTSADAFRALGVSQRELKTLDFNQLIGEVADGMTRLGPGAERTAASMRLFGRGWQTIVPVLRDGSKGMQEQLNLARKYGATFSGGTIKSMHDFIQAQRESRFATLGLQVAFSTQLAPALTKAILGVARFVKNMRDGKGVAGALVLAINEVVVSFRHFFEWVGNAIHNITRFGHGVRDVLRGVWAFFSDTFNNIKRIFGNVMAAIARGFERLFDLGSKIPGKIGDKFDEAQAAAHRFSVGVDRLGEEIRRLPRKKEIQVMVKTAWQDFLSGDVKPLVQSPGGDGWGIEGKVTNSARGAVQRGIRNGSINPFGSVGALPLFGGEGGLMGANPILSPFAALGNRMGLRVTSGFRPGSITSSGNLSLHATGHAIDMADGPGAMLSYGLLMARAFGSRLKELIHSPMGFSIKNGQRVAPYAVADHYDHVHVAMARGGQARTAVRALVGEKGPEVVDLPAGAIVHPAGVSRRLKTGDGWGRALIAARRAGFRGRSLQTALAVAAAESGNFTDFVGDGGQSFSPWQIYLPAHPQYSRSRLLSDWTYAAKAAYSISSGGSNWGPWTMFNNGGYRAYLDDAARAISGSRRGLGRRGGAHHGGGSSPRGTTGATTNFEILRTRAENRLGRFRANNVDDDPATAANEYLESRLDDVGGLKKLRGYIKGRIGQIKRRLRKINRALRGRLRPRTRARLLNEKLALLQELGGLQGDIRDINAEIKEDTTTPVSEADGAGGGTDPALELHNRLLQERNDIERQLVANQKTLIALTQTQGPAILAGVIAAVEGTIGGKVGTGFNLPATAGVTAAYR